MYVCPHVTFCADWLIKVCRHVVKDCCFVVKPQRSGGEASVILTNGHFRTVRPLPHQTDVFCITNKHSESTWLRVLVFELMMTSNLNEIRDLANPSQKHIIGNNACNSILIYLQF